MIELVEQACDWYLDRLERGMPRASYDTVTVVAIIGWGLIVLLVALALIGLVAWWV